MILKIVSKSSEKKDNVTLRALYAKPRIPEYWLVDARSEPSRFEIPHYANEDYQSNPSDEGWTKSNVFGCSFQLVRETDPLGHPQFVAKVKATKQVFGSFAYLLSPLKIGLVFLLFIANGEFLVQQSLLFTGLSPVSSRSLTRLRRSFPFF